MREALEIRVLDSESTILGHDLKEALRWLGPEVSVRCRLIDAMLLAYLDNPALRDFSLTAMALERLRYRAIGLEEVGFRKGSGRP